MIVKIRLIDVHQLFFTLIGAYKLTVSINLVFKFRAYLNWRINL